jgi:hypothetical protein
MKRRLGRVGLAALALPLLWGPAAGRAAVDDLLQIHETKTLEVELTK